ncbi:MAG: hypothetical protein JWO56_3495, partial [Acidobacteria bacterium]|nr:hypothetical protein [Acidobacteriota bacterium]
MSALEIAWSVVGILAPVVVGVGFAVLSLPTAEFRAARACLVLSALMLAGMAVFWSFESDASTVRLWTVDGAIGIGICTLLPAGLLWISNRQHMFKEPTQSPVSLDPASVRELAGAIGDAVHPPGIDRRPTLPGLGQSEEARYWSERASWDRLQQDGKATKQLVVVGDDAPDILLELSATRASNADLYKAIPISVYSAVDVVAMNVQIDPVESGVWHGGNYGGDTDTAAGPILCNTRLVFELVAHIPGNTKVSVFP